MFRVSLISMPFGAVHIPSLGLTQLKGALARELGADVCAEIHYLTHDFAEFFGLNLYRYLSDDSRTTVTGLTDWLFRDLAFPGSEDTSDRYIVRYMPALGCRCEDGQRGKFDGCASSPNGDPSKATSVPCCLGPNLLNHLITKRAQLGVFLDELIDRYDLASAPLVGFTSMFDQTVASIAMAQRIKARNPGVVTVIGGASCEPGVGRVLARQVDAIDYAFAGPALRAFPQFIRFLMNGERDKCWNIPGVHSRDGQRNHFPNERSSIGEEEDINRRLPLDYDDFLEKVCRLCPEVEPELLLETSRGCWWGERAHCTFCGINGATMEYRSMSAENAIAQFQELFERYPDVREFTAVDNILDPSYYTNVFPHVHAPEGSRIFYETRVINDEDQMKRLAAAGVTKIQPGLEALSTPVLKLMKKGSTAFQNILFLKRVFKHGIDVDWNLLTGFPKEDSSVYPEYVAFIPSLVHLPAPVATFPVRFDRHSPYQKDPKAYDLDLRPLDFYSMLYPFPEDDLKDFAYFWSDQNLTNGYLFNIARWQRKIEGVIDLWRRRWYVRDGLLRPELKSTKDDRVIYDSRTGEAVEHRVSVLGSDILRWLERPMSLSDLQRELGAGEDRIRKELESLDACRLLFTERGRMLSLVCEPEPEPGAPRRHRERERERLTEQAKTKLPLLVESRWGAFANRRS